MSTQSIRLLPHHKIQLQVFEGNGELFVKRFRNVWSRLPLGARRRILAHWRKSPSENGPLIELSNFFGGRDDIYGQTKQNGHMVKFNAGEFDQMPDETAHWIIAHELAHVYNRAIGNLPIDSRDGALCFDEAKNEETSDKLGESWGFNKIWCTLWDSNVCHNRKSRYYK